MLLQLGPGLCNHSLTVYVGDVHSAFTFINSFDPHNSGEETGAGLCPLGEKQKLSLQATVTQPGRDTLFSLTPLVRFHCCR